MNRLAAQQVKKGREREQAKHKKNENSPEPQIYQSPLHKSAQPHNHYRAQRKTDDNVNSRCCCTIS